MFDQLSWWQVLLILAPIAGATAWIRRLETQDQSIDFSRLGPAQKAWVLLLLLPPGTAASAMCQMSPDEREGYLRAGRMLQGGRQMVVRPVLREFLSLLEPGAKVKASDPAELLDRVVAHCERPAVVVKMLRKHWPPPKLEEIVEPVVRTVKTSKGAGADG